MEDGSWNRFPNRDTRRVKLGKNSEPLANTFIRREPKNSADRAHKPGECELCNTAAPLVAFGDPDKKPWWLCAKCHKDRTERKAGR